MKSALLLASIMLVYRCCPMAAAASSPEQDRASEREKALEHIRELGGKYTVDDKQPGQPVVTVDLRGRNNLIDSDLVFLALIPEVQELNLSNTGVTDDCLEHIAALHDLKTLHLDVTKISDAGLERLQSLKELRSLFLFHTRVTDSGLPSLKSLPKLELLFLGGNEIGDAGVESLSGLPALRKLYLDDTLIDDNGMAKLEGLPSLTELGLGKTRTKPPSPNAPPIALKPQGRITDSGLTHLAKLQGLKLLRFARAGF